MDPGQPALPVFYLTWKCFSKATLAGQEQGKEPRQKGQTSSGGPRLGSEAAGWATEEAAEQQVLGWGGEGTTGLRAWRSPQREQLGEEAQ